MPDQSDNHSDRLTEIDAVLKHLRQLKEDTVKMIISLQKERDQKGAKPRKARKIR